MNATTEAAIAIIASTFSALYQDEPLK